MRSLPISMFKAIMTSPAGTVCPWSGRSQWCRGVTATAWWRPIAAGRSRRTPTAATSIVDKAITLAFCIVTPLKHIQPWGVSGRDMLSAQKLLLHATNLGVSDRENPDHLYRHDNASKSEYNGQTASGGHCSCISDKVSLQQTASCL